MACGELKRAWDNTTDFFEGVWDVLSDAAQDVWKKAVVPYLEESFALLGIVDETVLIVDKSTNLLFRGSTVDLVQSAKEKAALSNIKKGGGFFRWYIAYRNAPSDDMRNYFLHGSNGRYIHGLPTAEIKTHTPNLVAVDIAITADTGTAITVLDAISSTPKVVVYAHRNLQSAPYLYKPWNNTLTYTDSLGVYHSDYAITSIIDNTTTYQISVVSPTVPLETRVFSIASSPRVLSVVARYYLNGTPSTEWFYWIYDTSSTAHPNVIPEVGILYDMEMLPVAILKGPDGVVNTDKTSTVYLSTRALLGSIGLDVDALITQLEEDANYSLVQDAYVNFSISPNDTDKIVSEALWLSFYTIVGEYPVAIGEGGYIATFTEQNIKNSAVWSDQNITTEIVGDLPDFKEYHHQIDTYEYSSYDDEGNATTEIGTKLIIRHAYIIGSPGNPGMYDEIIINNYGTLAAISKAGKTEVAIQDLQSPACTIPLSIYVISQMSKEEQMYLFEKSLRLDVYAAQLIELEWYETSSFLLLFNGVLTVISIVSIGTAASATEIFKKLAYAYLISELVVKIAEITGNEVLAAIIGIVASIALSDQVDFNKLGLVTGEQLLSISTDFANNLTAAYGVETEQLKKDIDDVNRVTEERLKTHADSIKEIKEGRERGFFLEALKSVDTTMYPAIKAQYNYDLLYNYDSIIANYYDNQLRLGVV